MIKVDFEKAKPNEDFKKYEDKAKDAMKTLLASKEMTGWIDLPDNYDKNEFNSIKELTVEIKKNAKTLVVIGIGGSYLGARAAIEYLSDYYRKNDIEVIFAGNGLSEKYLSDIISYVKDKSFYVNVISKSGGTLEPSLAFNVFKKLLIEKYGKEEAVKRIIATTDKKKGILKEEADKEGYRTLVVPDDIGGRYSVLSAVGLLPIAVAGFDIEKLMTGAKNAKNIYKINDIEKNDAMKYAAIRNMHLANGKDIEVFSTFNESMRYFSEWLKQLFGESECKSHKGLFPASLTLSTDLHSMGQLMQDGKRNLIETFIFTEDDFNNERIKYNDKFFVNDVNKIALRSSEKAHFDGDVPVIKIETKKQNEETLGELFYFFMMVCAISATILGVNPFDQPGVEEYKKNIKELLTL